VGIVCLKNKLLRKMSDKNIYHSICYKCGASWQIKVEFHPLVSAIASHFGSEFKSVYEGTDSGYRYIRGS
jgi:hypothetical protein